jgi:hypothetical protein
MPNMIVMESTLNKTNVERYGFAPAFMTRTKDIGASRKLVIIKLNGAPGGLLSTVKYGSMTLGTVVENIQGNEFVPGGITLLYGSSSNGPVYNPDNQSIVFASSLADGS